MTDERKQAEEILEKKGFNIICHKEETDTIKQMLFEPMIDAMIDFASLKVADATKEMYPKEFVEWLKENCDTINIGESIDPQWLWEVRDRLITADTKKVFEYWKTINQ